MQAFASYLVLAAMVMFEVLRFLAGLRNPG
jgi:hypothetical protein